MKDKFYSYFDSFTKITIIYPKKQINSLDNKKFFVLIEDEKLELVIKSIDDIGLEYKFNCLLTESLSLNVEYTIIDEVNNRSCLRTGAILRTDLFEMLYSYSRNNLGFIYKKEETSFKVWSPTAKEVEIELVSPNGKINFYELDSMPKGVWGITVKGDLDCYKYRYRVRINSEFKTVLDPYAISSDANASYNYVVNPDKFYEFKYPRPDFSGKAVDAIIYELHIRDFTIDKCLNNKYAGKYLGLLEKINTPNGLKTGIEYIKDLGVTHVQLLPFFDFGGVDELNPNKDYNWGYNPVQYLVPEGSYSTNPNDPYTRINELRMLIDEFHHAGIRVVMDVVYNHVYKFDSFAYNNLAPGYFYRYDDRGMMTNASGCGNDIASERSMVNKFIQDSSRYWSHHMGIDGFRFDLMGLLDIKTINDVLTELKSACPDGLIYGEGWNMPSNVKPNMQANMSNCDLMPEVSFFNDRFRNAMKGNQWNGTNGYAIGGAVNFNELLYLITGSSVDNYLFNSPNQSINYIECHDNFTFYDYIKKNNPNLSEEVVKDYCRLGLSLVIISQGVPFIHAGEEFYRTKHGVENSYKSNDEINKIDWLKAQESIDSINMVKDLIQIRKEHSSFRLDRKSVIKERTYLSYQESIKAKITGPDENIVVFIKNNYNPEHIEFRDDVKFIFDGIKKTSEIKRAIDLSKPGVYIYVKGRENNEF